MGNVDHRLVVIALLLVGLAALSPLLRGCDGGDYETAQVEGVVYCNGKPLTEGGQVCFYPQPRPGFERYPGKAASGTLKPDGSFELTTYKRLDGAVIGKCRVKVFEPTPLPAFLGGPRREGGNQEGDGDGEGGEQAIQLACGMTDSDVYLVEVKPGKNRFDIRLPMEH